MTFTRTLSGVPFTFTCVTNGDNENTNWSNSYGVGNGSSVGLSSYSNNTSTETFVIKRQDNKDFVFTSLYCNNLTFSSQEVLGGYNNNVLVGSTQTISSPSSGVYNFGGIVVDEVRISATDLSIYIDDFSGIIVEPATHLNFDGANDSVSVPASVGNAISQGSEITIEYWFKGTNLQSAVRFQNGNNFIVAGWGGTNPQFIVSTDGVTSGVSNGTESVIEDNTWHHIACVWKKNEIFATYLDGVLQNSRVAANVNLPDLSGVVGQLGSFLGTSEFMTGNLDDVRIWNIARTPLQIFGSKNCELQGNESGLVAYYKFNQGLGAENNTAITSLTDATGINNGTLVNFTKTGATSNFLAGSPVTTGSTIPTAPTASAQSYCGVTTANSLVPAISSTIKWYDSATALVTTDNLTTGIYYVAAVNANGCESTRTSAVITVNAIPTAPTASAQSFCGATTANSLVPAISATIKWYDSATATTDLATTDNLTTGTYYVVAVNANGCESSRTLVAVTINPNSDNITILSACDTYTWANNATTYTTSGTYTGTTTNCVTEKLVLTINVLPIVDVISNQEICNNTATTSVNFTGTPVGTIFNWTNNDPSISLAASGTGNINSFTATNSTNVPVTATVTVTPVVNNISFTETITLPNQTSTFLGNSRGYWFTAPVSFTIKSLLVPTSASTGDQNIAVVKFDGNTAPPVFNTTTNAFTVLYLTQNNNTASTIPVNININAGDVIGILGDRATVNSYYSPSPASTTINGINVSLGRLAMQLPLNSNVPQNLFTESSGYISRVFFEYEIVTSCSGTPKTFTYIVNPKPIAPITPTAQTFCGVATVANLTATGTVIKWYADAIGGTELLSTDALVSGNNYYATDTVNGCESARTTLPVTITPISDNVTVVSACDSYSWNGTVYTTSGIKTGTTTNCVTEKLDLTITPSTNNVTVVSACDSYSWNGTVYTTSGIKTGTTTNCVTEKLDLTINTTPIITGNSSQTLDITATLTDIVVTPTNVVWYASLASATAGTSPLANNTIVANATYYGVNTSNGCPSNPFEVTISTVNLSNENFALQSLIVYPNPSTGIFNISLQEDAKITVNDILGKVIYTKKVKAGNNNIDISNYQSGMYLLNITNENGSVTKKLIKE